MPPGSDLTCVDLWAPYVSARDLAEGNGIAAMHQRHEEAYASAQSVVAAYPDRKVTLRKGSSSDVLLTLPPYHYDLIYLDGSHYYNEFRTDLILARRLLKSGGILCGDDCELIPTPERLALAKQLLDYDYVSIAGEMCHPGVMLALSEELDTFTIDCGLWWVRL